MIDSSSAWTAITLFPLATMASISSSVAD